jgi:dCMP deaminase
MKFDNTYMQMAQCIALHSKAIRKKVGAILVTNHGVVLPGFNGTPAGMDNNCEEDKGYDELTQSQILVTKPEVIHAELNCILKAAKEGVSVVDSVVYVTLSPCVQCAAMMVQSGVCRVVFGEQYRDNSGILLLKTAGVAVQQL